jgi:hypothetical protein
MPIIPSTPKLRRFGQNGVVLEILGGETSETPPELPPIYRKPPDTKKLSDTPLNFQILSLRTLLVVNCPNYPPLQNYAVLGSSKTTPFWAKRRSFAF